MKLIRGTIAFTSITVGMLFSATILAEEEFSDSIKGDVGVAVYTSTNPVRGEGNTVVPIPYAYFDYGRFFARFDTFGFKTLPVGYGYLEVLGRINLDGYQTSSNPLLRGIGERKNSLPLGIGTFQETPIGGFFLNAFYDANKSHGNLYELIYAGKFDVGNTVLYPMAGFEHLSAQYTQYFYGVSAAEAVSSIYPAYTPKAATTSMLGFAWDVPVTGDWVTNIYMLRRWLGSGITQSPLVNTRVQDEAFVSLSYRYK